MRRSARIQEKNESRRLQALSRQERFKELLEEAKRVNSEIAADEASQKEHEEEELRWELEEQRIARLSRASQLKLLMAEFRAEPGYDAVKAVRRKFWGEYEASKQEKRQRKDQLESNDDDDCVVLHVNRRVFSDDN